MTIALESERDFRLTNVLSVVGLERMPFDRWALEVPFPLVTAGGGVEPLDDKGVAVCFMDRVDARERVFVPP